jgi:hypothetical protein
LTLPTVHHHEVGEVAGLDSPAEAPFQDLEHHAKIIPSRIGGHGADAVTPVVIFVGLAVNKGHP